MPRTMLRDQPLRSKVEKKLDFLFLKGLADYLHMCVFMCEGIPPSPHLTQGSLEKQKTNTNNDNNNTNAMP